MRFTNDFEVPLSRKCTEDQPLASTGLSTTPLRSTETKRRRLTSETAGGLVLRGDLNVTTAADANLGAVLRSKEPDVTIRNTLVLWSNELKRLQPKVYVSEHLVECGLALFRHLRLVQWHALLDGNLSHEQLSCQLTLRHDLAACYWTALKHCSVRTAVPNRSLMSKATATDPTTLGQREVDAMVTMEWEVNAVLRVVGLVQ